MNKLNYFAVAVLGIGMLLAGCTTQKSVDSAAMYGSGNLYGDPLMGDMPLDTGVATIGTDAVQTDRMLIWKGSMTVEVVNFTNATQQLTALTKKCGGYVESTTFNDGTGAYGSGSPAVNLTLRIPSDKLEAILSTVEGFGKVAAKSLSSDDVTERFIDTQARLKTKKKLRERLQKLLDKADEVKDVLAIEKELNRLQADIDSMEARLKAMKGKVDLATLTLTLRPCRPEMVEVKEIPGPIGYLWNGTKWCVRKLFVWREAGSVEEEVTNPCVLCVGVFDPVTMIEEKVLYSGETLDDIARQYGVSKAEILRLNNIADESAVREGMTLRIPIIE